MKKVKGITLIALIITIIVMLILVGVTINVAMNGKLFGNAKKARDDTKKEADREELISAITAAYNYINGEVNIGQLEADLTSLGWTMEGSNFPYTFKKGENSFLIYADGTITDILKGGSFTIELQNGGMTVNGTIINVYTDTDEIVQVKFNTNEEAYSFLFDFFGIEDKTKPVSYLIETAYNMFFLKNGETAKTYEQIKGIFANQFGIEDPSTLTEEIIIKMMFAGNEYNNYSLIELASGFATEEASKRYEPEIKKIRVNGQEIPDNQIEWDGFEKAKFVVAGEGTYLVELELDGKTATSQITIVFPETIVSIRRFYIYYISTNKHRKSNRVK